MNSEKIVAILTSTINVNNCSYLQRTSPEDRSKDLIISVDKWLKNTDWKFVIVDNSKADLFEILKTQYSEYKDRLQLLSYDGNSYPRTLGKGFGEKETINYALEHDTWASNQKYVFKISGRYFASKLPSLITLENINKYNWIYQKHENLTYCMFFICSRVVWDNNCRNAKINDSATIYFEHILQSAINTTSLSNALNIEVCGWEAISGTNNTSMTWAP